MSATNRGGKRSESDYYPTPSWCVTRLLEAVKLPGGRWLEPAAGDGAIIRAVNSQRSDVRWRVVELDSRFKTGLGQLVGKQATTISSFLDLAPDAASGPFDVVITNPPYSLAMPVIEHALGLETRFIVMLLRLNFLASGGRADFMRRHAPDVYVMPNRPSFSGAGTDSIEYAWFIWHGKRRRSRGVIRVLAPTSAEERANSVGMRREKAVSARATRAVPKK